MYSHMDGRCARYGNEAEGGVGGWDGFVLTHKTLRGGNIGGVC